MPRHRKPTTTRAAELMIADQADDQMYARVTRIHDSNHFDVLCYADMRVRRARRPGRMRAGRTRVFIADGDLIVVRARPGCTSEANVDILHVYREPAHIRTLMSQGLIPRGSGEAATTRIGTPDTLADEAFDFSAI